MKEPPFGDNPAPPPAPAAPAPETQVSRRETQVTPPPPPRRPEREAVTREDLRALVSERFPKGRWKREDQWEGLCPTHDDTMPSFGIGLDESDKEPGEYLLVMSCQKCGKGQMFAKAVCAAVGIELKDTFTYTPGKHRPAAKAKGDGERKLEDVALYTDENGVGLYEVERWRLPDGRKTFLQRRILEDGRKEYGDMDKVRKVLFNLPAVRAAAKDGKTSVYFVEGEKCAKAVIGLGLTATTNSGGAQAPGMKGKFNEELASQLAGVHELIVMPDNDDAGRAHAATVMELARPHVGSVVLLDLARFWPEIKVKGDIANFLEAHPGIDGARKLAEFVVAAKQPQELERVGAAPVVEAEKVTAFAKKLKRESDGLLLMDEKQLDWRNDEIPWRDRMAYTISQGGKLKYTSCPYNIGLVLEQHEYLKGRIRYDVFANEIRFTPPERWREPGPERFWCEKDTTEFRMWADRYLNPESTTQFKREMVEECVLKVADDHPCHPLREWLESLKWDGEARLKHWLSFFCNVEEDEYVQLVGEKWMISAVARIFEPGCKADHMLVLRGPQGIKKTGLFETLGGPYYTEYRGVKLDDKDGKQFLQGKWIVEFSELEALNRVEAGAMKAFLTGREDRFREPFGRKTRDFKRSNVFAGTINEGEFLKDETGNRRFWIVDCGSARIDLKRLELMRPQLFAEAVALYRAGERWWLEGREEELAREVQADHMEPSLHEDSIRDWLEDESRAPGTFLAEAGTHNGERFVTLEMVWRHALKGNVVGWNKTQQYQTAAGLARAGWKKKLYRPGPGIRRKAWFKVAPEQPKLEEDPDVLPY